MNVISLSRIFIHKVCRGITFDTSSLQECIAVGCILPARYRAGVGAPWQRPPLDRDPPLWTETPPLWTQTLSHQHWRSRLHTSTLQPRWRSPMTSRPCYYMQVPSSVVSSTNKAHTLKGIHCVEHNCTTPMKWQQRETRVNPLLSGHSTWRLPPF